ncbi:hypothetical protein GQ600_6082 [Phytophthora cactorum]|nr:hypothetical protein GQ600_6082 [Phytophthora cactorum]
MQLSAPTASLETKQPLFIAEAWSGDAVAQPEPLAFPLQHEAVRCPRHAVEGPTPSATAFVLHIAQSALSWCMRSAAPRLWCWFHGDEDELGNEEPLQSHSLQQVQLLEENMSDFKTQQELMIRTLEDLLEEVKRMPKCRCESEELQASTSENAG